MKTAPTLALLLLTSTVAAQDMDQAFDAYERADFGTARVLFENLAARGEAGAAFYLGRMHETGRGVAENPAEAMRWYRTAAEAGHRGAQFSLGLSYASGTGVTKDMAQAARWFEAAARRGYPSAQLNLGTLFALGDGVARDPLRAYAWWHLAASNGNLTARDNRDRLRQNLEPEQLLRAEEMARTLRRDIDAGAGS